MSALFSAAVIVAVLGSAVVGGVFFAFSSFVMKALARVPSSEGIAAMQSINVVVINPGFLGVFVGTAAVSLGLIVIALLGPAYPASGPVIVGAIVYVAGVFLVTALGNVPLNDQLAAVTATDAAAADVWSHYLDRWMLWNHVRTVAAVVAAGLFVAGLVRGG